jgi:hypothetical protein
LKSFEGLWLAPFVAQGLAISVDEFYFHRRRGLPRWECIGHPLDTLSVLLCYLCLLLLPYGEGARGLYLGLAVFSSLLITKDEFVHKDLCSKAENWLHAVLFILHPLTLIAAGFLWSEGRGLEILQIQAGLIFVFLLYQIFYWSPRWVKTSK